MLVSAPQTTAANVFGFGGYYTANSVAEVLQGGIWDDRFIKGGTFNRRWHKEILLKLKLCVSTSVYKTLKLL